MRDSRFVKILCFLLFLPAVIVQSSHGLGPLSQNPPQAGSEQSLPPDSNAAPHGQLPISGEPQVLRLFAGKSMVIQSPEPLKRVSVTSEDVAAALIVSPNQLLLHGLQPGVVTLLLWNEQEEIRFYDLQVEVDLRHLREALQDAFPGETIQISQSGGSVVLSGIVSSAGVAERAEAMAKTVAKGVVNLLSPAAMTQVVLLQVRFAEVDRIASQQLGANILSTGALNTPGTISTQQFQSLRGQTDVSSAIPGTLQGFSSEFQLSDLLNIFVFRPDLNLGLLIKALQQRSLLQILAEPNLLALGGKEASFVAGGEFPIPILQGAGGAQTVTIQFKEFGVRLKFLASPNPDGTISLKVAPEVSTLDYANAITLSGFTIPALSTRRAETEVQLKDGQSFAIAGLIDNRVIETASKIPWLGDVPFLGKLFQSRDFKQNKSELLVMVTPRLVKPIEPGQLPPDIGFPAPFLDTGKFDEKTGKAPPAKQPKRPAP